MEPRLGGRGPRGADLPEPNHGGLESGTAGGATPPDPVRQPYLKAVRHAEAL